MKQTKQMKKVFSVIAAVLIFSGCSVEEGPDPLQIQNTSDNTIYYRPMWHGKGVYPDTTLSFEIEKGMMKIDAKASIFDQYPSPTLEHVMKKLPKDTLSIYFFEKYTLDGYSPETKQEGYNVLARYDLSLQNIKKLIHKISYPPTEEMKESVKMYIPD